jgi:Rps23 Pro-64 3,4-dihydroxylase Tpa1-like proline 4-hydroxylase
MTKEQLDNIRLAAYAGAQKGFQYLYENYPVYDAYHAGECASPFDQLFDFLNSGAFLAFTRTVTGHRDITFADAQLTRFGPGDFLTVHNDDVDGKDRRAAFVLNMTPEWEADWGGILQFFDRHKHVEGGFTPCFNALNIFSIPKPHAVSQVSTFSRRARYSITGWLRAGTDPKARL